MPPDELKASAISRSTGYNASTDAHTSLRTSIQQLSGIEKPGAILNRLSGQK